MRDYDPPTRIMKAVTKEDLYLAEIKELERKSRYRKASKIYREHSRINTPIYKNGRDFLDMQENDLYAERALAQTVAYRLMEGSDPAEFFLGAELYEKLGKGRKAIPKLVKDIRAASDGGYLSIEGFRRAEDFIKRNQATAAAKDFREQNAKLRHHHHGGIEGRVSVFILSSVAGIALSIYSLTATGNAISNLTNTTSGLLGVIFFVVGLAGLVFGKR